MDITSSISVDADTWRKFKAKVALQGRTISAVLCELIEEFLKRKV